MTNWIRVNDPDKATALLPAWFATRMMAARGSYGFLLTTGDVIRASRITAVHVSSSATILIDVLLDCAGVPEGVDPSWRSKNFLGAPAIGAPLATLNLNQITVAVEFVAAEIVESPSDLEAISDLAAAPLQLGHVPT
jgi:hypothetical protein